MEWIGEAFSLLLILLEVGVLDKGAVVCGVVSSGRLEYPSLLIMTFLALLTGSGGDVVVVVVVVDGDAGAFPCCSFS